MTKAPKTKQGAERQAMALLNKYRRDYAGGGAFGFDWPTLRVNSPDTYTRFQELKALHAALPNRKA